MMAQAHRITNASQERRCIVKVGGLIPRRTSSVSTDDSMGLSATVSTFTPRIGSHKFSFDALGTCLFPH